MERKNSNRRNLCASVFTALALLMSCVWTTPFTSEGNAPDTKGKEREQEQETPAELAQLYARSAVLMDAESGRVLFGKEADAPRPMASTTKIMTCILTLEAGIEEETAEVSENAVSQPKVRLGVQKGEQYKVKDLLYSLMLESHNDSAVVIAEAAAGSAEAFADKMNEKARKIGCRDTYFVTPNGLDGYDEGGAHSTTAADLARIMRYCIMESPEKEAFLEITKAPSYSFSDAGGKRTFSCRNHNAFLTMMDGALSGKTGFTGDAGYCYVGALEDDGRTFIVTLLACGWPNNKGYKWADTKKLMNYGKEHYQYETVEFETDFPAVRVKEGVSEKGLWKEAEAEMVCEGGKMELLLGDTEEVTTETILPDTLDAPVEQGETVGAVQVFLNGKAIRELEIKTGNSVKKRTFPVCMEEMLSRLLL